jgi:hypothetical protein
MRLSPRYCMAAFLLSIGAVAWHAAEVAQGQGAEKSETFVFDAQPREIVEGETAVLRWSIKGATKITIEEVPEAQAGEGRIRTIGTFDGGRGTLRIAPKETTAYVIECEGSAAYSCASLTVRVKVKQRNLP